MAQSRTGLTEKGLGNAKRVKRPQVVRSAGRRTYPTLALHHLTDAAPSRDMLCHPMSPGDRDAVHSLFTGHPVNAREVPAEDRPLRSHQAKAQREVHSLQTDQGSWGME
jgi:hypothetical protein